MLTSPISLPQKRKHIIAHPASPISVSLGIDSACWDVTVDILFFQEMAEPQHFLARISVRACCSNFCGAVNAKQLHAEHGGQQCQNYQAHEEPGRVPWLKYLILFLSGSFHQHQCEEEPCFQHAEPGTAAEGILHDLLKRGHCRCAG